MYPGFETTGELRITNRSGDDGRITLRVVEVSSGENGCSHPELGVDDSCGDREGELASELVLSVDERTDNGFVPVVSSALLDAFSSPILLDDRLGGDEAVTYRLTLALPQAAGNETQTDTASFSVEILGEPSAQSGAVLGKTVDRDGLDEAAGSSSAEGTSVDVSAEAAAAGPLPPTGSDIGELVVSGLLLGGVGFAAASFGRRRSSGAPDGRGFEGPFRRSARPSGPVGRRTTRACLHGVVVAGARQARVGHRGWALVAGARGATAYATRPEAASPPGLVDGVGDDAGGRC